MINEQLLYYLWKFQLFETSDLLTCQEENLEIISPGIQNFNAGPDFFNALVRIGQTLWAGNIEIHVNASDWLKHGHQFDPTYGNVILHVVYENDRNIEANDVVLPALELKSRIDISLLKTHQYLMRNKSWVPCASQIRQVSNLVVQSVIERRLLERLIRRSNEIERIYRSCGSWSKTFWFVLAINFGFKVNELPFRMLIENTPWNLQLKLQKDLQTMEALLFGQAGFLEDTFADSYPNLLKKKYSRLKSRNQLSMMPKHIWKFFRLRPSNFPTIRIAQYAALFCKDPNWFELLKYNNSLQKWRDSFSVEASGYWLNHLRFDVISISMASKIGKVTINNLLINSVVPITFAYGLISEQDIYTERALDMLADLPCEQNNTIKKWSELNIDINSAMQSQGLLELKNNHCSHKKCLNCGVGNVILRANR